MPKAYLATPTEVRSSKFIENRVITVRLCGICGQDDVTETGRKVTQLAIVFIV